MFRPFLLTVTLATAAGLAGCPEPEGSPVDGGRGLNHTLPVLRESDLLGLSDDAGSPPLVDAGVGPADAGATDAGQGPVPVDAGSGQTDAGPGQTDAGPQDAGPSFEFVADRGEPCAPASGTGCGAGLVCVALYASGAGTCEYPCATEGQACPTGGVCTDLGPQGAPELACAAQAAEGQGCDIDQLVVCAGEGVCLANENEPLGGTCRTPCQCPAGTSCTAPACGGGGCVVIASGGSGFCGAAAPVGGACSPVDQGVFCEGAAAGAATCILSLEEPEAGTCYQRCSQPSDCDVVPGTECFGQAADGLCLPTTDLGQGDLCTLPDTTPAVPLTCAAGLDCVRLHDDLTAGFGVCARACLDDSQCAPDGAACFAMPDADFPGVGNRCLRELPRGSRGCDPPEPICEGDTGVCVGLGEDDTICKLTCDVATCPGGACACPADERCLGSFLADPTVGVCGREAGLGEACDEDDDVYCAPAPDEEVETNAFSLCLDRCVFICRFAPQGQTPVDLACPAGLECRPDPTGRLMSDVHICVAPGG